MRAIRFIAHHEPGGVSMAGNFFQNFSHAVSRGAGHPVAFSTACAGIALWAVTGPIFGFSETWQFVVNTATTIITFLMVFVLQHSQNRDGEAVQAKLDELILAVREADNQFIRAEELTDQDLTRLRQLVAKEASEAQAEAPGHNEITVASGVNGSTLVAAATASSPTPKQETENG